ncbi:SDR family oxidoreductase [Streptomyces sp. XD-27]|uniref:SDR family NAD(P)-dependent oxidoreductase n=1 Tax=Streptomyces sp. XD-27 TaxID=3062779 RepID=UPI0026F43635|nr:SDR family NAD(P)-dependent oxidoreductase [Streptomyces sp. XD-27]WKX71386.1 SDR family NAD(P)-dependent oxidoreductase [Streptomyces sp. XD-27]
MPRALVTGGSRGIGAAFADRLAAKGCDLLLVGRDKQGLRATATAMRRTHGVAADALVADLAQEQDLALVEERAAAGVDILVNNAGFAHPAPFPRVPVEDEIRMLRVHCEAVLRLTHAALPAMNARGRGGIINVASIWALYPRSTYGASKAWMTAFSESLRHGNTVRPGVRVMALCPGYVRTELHQRTGRDISRVPGFLWLPAAQVADTALRDLARNRRLSIPGTPYRILAALGGISPRIPSLILTHLGSRPTQHT